MFDKVFALKHLIGYLVRKFKIIVQYHSERATFELFFAAYYNALHPTFSSSVLLKRVLL